jgi:hypothetical protein
VKEKNDRSDWNQEVRHQPVGLKKTIVDEQITVV